jgi:hypothetical protein
LAKAFYCLSLFFAAAAEFTGENESVYLKAETTINYFGIDNDSFCG